MEEWNSGTQTFVDYLKESIAAITERMALQDIPLDVEKFQEQLLVRSKTQGILLAYKTILDMYTQFKA